MSTWPHTTPDPSAENLTERLARSRDLAGPHRAGDTFGQGGWQHHDHDVAPAPVLPSVWLMLVPFLLLLVVAVGLTVLLLVLGAQS